MDRSQKADAVAELNRTFGEVGVVVVTRNLGMTVKQSTDLRNKMREAGASYKVSKNKLAKIAADGTDYAAIADLLTGPTALATSARPRGCGQGRRRIRQDERQARDRRRSNGRAAAQRGRREGARDSLPSLDELRAQDRGASSLHRRPSSQPSPRHRPRSSHAFFRAYAEKEAA